MTEREIAASRSCWLAWTKPDFSAFKKKAPPERGCGISTALDRRTLAQRSDAPLGCFFGWRFWLCRKLQYRCFLTVQ
jgi:hypothetical protein